VEGGFRWKGYVLKNAKIRIHFGRRQPEKVALLGVVGSREVDLTKYFWGGRRPKIILIFMFFSTCPFHLHRHPQQM
jgi:hypothetical protein